MPQRGRGLRGKRKRKSHDNDPTVDTDKPSGSSTADPTRKPQGNSEENCKRQRQDNDPTCQAPEPCRISTENSASNLYGDSEENSSVKKRPIVSLNVSSYIQEHEALKVALPTLKSDYAVVNARTRFLDGVTSMTKHKVKQMEKMTKEMVVELTALEKAHKELKEKNQVLEKRLNSTVIELRSTRETVKAMEQKMATVKAMEEKMAMMEARLAAMEGKTTAGKD